MSHRGVNIIDTLSYMQKKKKKQHSTRFRSGPFRDHSGANSGMAILAGLSAKNNSAGFHWIPQE